MISGLKTRRLPPLYSRDYHTWACGILVSSVLFRLQIFRTWHCLHAHVCCCCCCSCFPCCPPCAPLPSMYSALSSSASCCRNVLRAILLLVHSWFWCTPWIQCGHNPSQVEDVIEDRHWTSSQTADIHTDILPRLSLVHSQSYYHTSAPTCLTAPPAVSQRNTFPFLSCFCSILPHWDEFSKLLFLFAHGANQAIQYNYI